MSYSVCVRACVCVCVRVRVCGCVGACGCVCACVHACMHACVCGCGCACVCGWVWVCETWNFSQLEDEAILIKTLLHWIGSSTQAIRRFVCKFSAAQTIVSYWFSWCNFIFGNPSNQMVDFSDGALVKCLVELFRFFPSKVVSFGTTVFMRSYVHSN